MIFIKNVEVPRIDIDLTTGLPYLVKQEKQDIAIKFYHVTEGKKKKNRGRYTRCEIIAMNLGEKLTRENGEIVGLGETRVFSGNYQVQPDRFDRRIGRFESLTRALNEGMFTKETRTEIWKAYRENCKLPTEGKLS